MNVMLQFKKGQFKPATTVDATFYDAVKKKALEGSSYGDEDANEGKASYAGYGYKGGEEQWYDEVYSEVHDWLLKIFGWGLPLLALCLGWSLTSFTKKTRNIKQLFGNTSAEIQTWYRDLPLGGDLHRSAGVLYAVDSKFCNEANLRRAQTIRTEHPVLRVGPLEMDTSVRTVRKNGSKLHKYYYIYGSSIFRKRAVKQTNNQVLKAILS